MSKGSLTTIEPRTKLRPTAKNLSNRNNKGPNMRREALARDSTQHNVAIPTGKKRGTLILKQLLQNTTTPLQGGGKKARGLENQGEIQASKGPGKTTRKRTTNPILPTRP